MLNGLWNIFNFFIHFKVLSVKNVSDAVDLNGISILLTLLIRMSMRFS